MEYDCRWKQAQYNCKATFLIIILSQFPFKCLSVDIIIYHAGVLCFSQGANWLSRKWSARTSHFLAVKRTKSRLERFISDISQNFERNILFFGFFMVDTKKIIHFSVGESGRYLPLLQWIIVNYWEIPDNVLHKWKVRTCVFKSCSDESRKRPSQLCNYYFVQNYATETARTV